MDSDAPPTVTTRRLPRQRVVALGALFGWVLPGLGQLWAGQPRKALLFGVAILSVFGVGWWLTGRTVVDYERYRLDFLAQMFLGGPTAFALDRSRDITLTSMPRFFDVGRLYVQVAGLLNLVAMADAVGDLIRHNRRILAMKAVEAQAASLASEEAPAPEASSEEEQDPGDSSEEADRPDIPGSERGAVAFEGEGA